METFVTTCICGHKGPHPIHDVSKGPHTRQARCIRCDRHLQWISNAPRRLQARLTEAIDHKERARRAELFVTLLPYSSKVFGMHSRYDGDLVAIGRLYGAWDREARVWLFAYAVHTSVVSMLTDYGVTLSDSVPAAFTGD